MSLLVSPEWQLAVHPTGVWGSAAAADPLAHSITLRFEGQVNYIIGGLDLFARLYENSSPTSSGATQVGAQTGTFQAFAPNTPVFQWDAALVTQTYVMGFVGSSNTGASNGVWMSVYDDVGMGSSPTGSGCCHDPMLDLILQAVTITISNTP